MTHCTRAVAMTIQFGRTTHQCCPLWHSESHMRDTQHAMLSLFPSPPDTGGEGRVRWAITINPVEEITQRRNPIIAASPDNMRIAAGMTADGAARLAGERPPRNPC